jgi:quinol-cytochrome oxidoreductase complex cytochrome b subunit
MARGIFYSLYLSPNIRIWLSGVVIFYLLMATAFLGYVLPWGQMSSWGATVITNLVSAIPVIGQTITYRLWGGFAIDSPTLVRFFVLHFILPFVILGLVVLHIYFLHERGSSLGNLRFRFSIDYITFYPYFVLKDFFSLMILLFVLGYLVFFEPNLLGHPDNYVKANPLTTPAHIVPE